MSGNHVLIVGYGNDTRGDDAAGRIVAERVLAMHLYAVRVLSLHQLAPEVADDVSKASHVIFVDACLMAEGSSPRVRQIVAETSVRHGGHFSGPEEILETAKRLCGRSPAAWSVDVPAVNFEFGETLSDTTARGVERAVNIVVSLTQFTEQEQEKCTKSA